MTDPMTDQVTPLPSWLKFELEPESGQLFVELQPHNQLEELTMETLDQWLVSKGYSHLFFFQDAKSNVLRKAKSPTPGRVLLGERRNASIAIKVDDDRMTAWATAEPAYGGEALTIEDLQAVLQEKKVIQEAVVTEEIEMLLQAKSTVHAVIAKGKQAKKGKDSRIEFLVDIEDVFAPKEGEDGRVDFKSTRDYIVVEEGTPIVRRVPPVKAVPGYDVTGTKLTADDGKLVPFGKEFTGVMPSDHDPSILVAQVKGHPLRKGKGLKIDPSLTLKGVNLATGNVYYDGSVVINGDVAPEMIVEVTGDIFIKGTVEKSTIIAGNNIVVKSGVIGDEQWDEQEEGNTPEFSTRLIAGGGLEAKFVSQAKINAKGVIKVREYIFNSLTFSATDLFLGQEGGKGVLAGGRTQVGHEIKANVIGSDAFVKTEVVVGFNPDELPQHEALRKRRKRRIREAKILIELMESLKPSKGKETIGKVELDKARHVKKTLYEIKDEVQQIDESLQQLVGDFDKYHENAISTTRTLHPNVAMTINGISLVTNNEHNAVTYVCRGTRLKIL